MSESIHSKCPYCGSSLLQEEDGYRCRFCKSFFPFEAEQLSEADDLSNISQFNQQVIEKQESVVDTEKEKADKEFAKRKARNELIGIATAFASCPFMALSKTMHMPYLMIPGFILWAFAAGFTAFQVYKAKKEGRKAAWGRILGLLLVAILMLIFIHPVGE